MYKIYFRIADDYILRTITMRKRELLTFFHSRNRFSPVHSHVIEETKNVFGRFPCTRDIENHFAGRQVFLCCLKTIHWVDEKKYNMSKLNILYY